MSRMKSLHASPEAAEQAYYDALEHADLDALMALWSDEEEVVCIHPGGPRLVGHALVRASWQEILANGPLHVRPVSVHAVHGTMVAVHNLIEQVILSGPSRSTKVINVHATNVYFKGPQGWRMVLHHASVPPEGRQETAQARPNVLH